MQKEAHRGDSRVVASSWGDGLTTEETIMLSGAHKGDAGVAALREAKLGSNTMLHERPPR